MTLFRGVLAMGVAALLGLAAPAKAETKVVLKGVHLCCGGCVKGVANAVKGIEGVKPACDRDNETVTITAPDDKAAQKALDALADAGYHGDSDSKALIIREEAAPKGKAKSVTLTGLHNCCRSCNNAIKGALKAVDGVTGNNATAKTATVEVTGDFDPAAVLKALNAAGFHAKIND